MINGLFDCVRDELDLIERQLAKDMKLKIGSVPDYITWEPDAFDRCLRPALLILSARTFNYSSERVLQFASLVQLIYLGTGIHFLIKDHESHPGLPVLIGDFLYSKCFNKLSELQGLDLMKEFARLICQIHEAGLERKEMWEQGSVCLDRKLEIIKKEYASLIAFSCYLGGYAANASKIGREILADFGLNLGVGLGILRYPVEKTLAMEYFRRAEATLTRLPKSYGRDEMLELTHELQRQEQQLLKVKVI